MAFHRYLFACCSEVDRRCYLYQHGLKEIDVSYRVNRIDSKQLQRLRGRKDGSGISGFVSEFRRLGGKHQIPSVLLRFASHDACLALIILRVASIYVQLYMYLCIRSYVVLEK